MTDEQIIKALENCLCESPSCATCLYDGETLTSSECMSELMKDLRDLINRQKAENEENEAKLAHQAETIHILEKALADRMKELEDSQDGHIRTAVEKDAEIERLEKILDKRCDVCPAVTTARKEFAKKLKRICEKDGFVDRYDIMRLLKEMDGDNNV